MHSSKVNLFIVFFSVVFICMISTLLVFESFKIDRLKEKSLKDFTILKNNLFKNDISIFPSNMDEYFRTFPELIAFRIKNESDQTIYFFSKSGLESLNDMSNYFKKGMSIYTVTHNYKFMLSNRSYSIDASFVVLAKKDLYNLLVKISIILVVYLLSIIFLLLFLNSTKTEFTKNNKFVSSHDNHIKPDQKITDELKKSASFDQDIVLTLVGSYENKIKENESDFHDLLNKQFPFHDLIFKYNENTFGILLPNIDLETGIQQIEKFDQTFVSSSSASLKFPIMFGLSSRNGRLISGSIILNEAKAALNKAMSDKDFPIIGFRPNPARYREYLSRLKPNS